MTNYIKNFYIKTNFIEKCFLILFCFLPISMIVGNLLINLTFFLILIIFFIDLAINKNFSFLKDNSFWLLIFFFLTLLVNLIFSLDIFTSLPRVLKILEIIAFVILLKKIITNYQLEFENIIFGVWAIIFSILIIDIIFEMIFGFNILGLKSYMPGRIASFFGDELVVGSFFIAYSSIYLGRISKLFKQNSNIKLTVLIVFLVTVSFLIGERSNFIKFFIISFFLCFFIINADLKYKISVIFLLLTTLFLIFNFNENIKYRYYSQSILNFKAETKNIEKEDSQNFIINTKNQIHSFIKWTEYGAHYNVAYKIFKENLIFGVGIKNFRVESFKDKYKDKYKNSAYGGGSTHPHQIHFELLSETGLFGYFSFLIFIIFSIYKSLESNFTNKNLYQFSGILYVCSTLLPVLPSGSFFSTFSSGLFWINYSVMVAYIKN